MPRDDDQSLGDEATLQGGKSAPADERSLGDRSTFGGGEGSSLSDLGEFADLPDHDMEIVDLSSRYKIEKSLGKGGMGEVLLATDTRLDRKVAIKRIRGDAASSKAAVARFLTEAKSVAALNHHNIVQIHDYGRDEQGPFLIMEYVAGGTLLDRCQEGPMPLGEAIDLACQLCDGLGRAHDAGIIHRDIKPANILLTGDGVPKLTDFGLAKADSRDHTMTMAGAVLGTLDFMAPEQRQDASLVDPRSDLWSLAATLYQMVTGKSPKIIRFELLPPSLERALGQALEDSKDERFQNTKELRTALFSSKAPPPKLALPLTGALATGECQVCHTLNESSRKFCRECAAPLLVPCLACSQRIAIWEKICGACGSDQRKTQQTRKDEYSAIKNKAENLYSEKRFIEAINKLAPLLRLEDQRFLFFQNWAVSYRDKCVEQTDLMQQKAKQALDTAKQYRAVFDYTAAIDSMQDIPPDFLTSHMRQYLKKLQTDLKASETLHEKICNANSSRELDNLLPLVERGIKLGCDPKLKSTLLARQQNFQQAIRERDRNFEIAKILFNKGDATGALQKVAEADVQSCLPSQQKFRSALIETVATESELETLLAKFKTDRLLAPQEVCYALAQTAGYLELNPHHDQASSLKQNLITRIDRNLHLHAAHMTAPVLKCLGTATLSKLPTAVFASVDINAIALDLPPITNSLGMELKLLPPGKFRMGSNGAEREVEIKNSFLLGVHEVTQEQYERVMGGNPSTFKGRRNPVERVRWEDCVAFCSKLSTFPEERAVCRVYRLPNESEWEYGCRAGTRTRYSFDNTHSQLSKYAWHAHNSGNKTHPIGEKLANPWGLHDMHGNVSEWCSDFEETNDEPLGRSSASHRVLRGGNFSLNAQNCSSSRRSSRLDAYQGSSLGFRVSLSLPMQ